MRDQIMPEFDRNVIASHTNDALTQSSLRRQLRTPALVFVLLLASVAMGAAFRFVSMNWDDFASLHPDERFLTRNLLPLVGGGLEFTPNVQEFPPHALLVRLDNSATQSLIDVQTNAALQVGTIRHELSTDIARWWIDEPRIETFAAAVDAIAALNQGEVDALILEQSEAQGLVPAHINIFALHTFQSQAVQRLQCHARYPHTGGIGGYFDTDCSPLNPYNSGSGTYAYGTLPLFMSHLLSNVVQQLETSASGLFSYQGQTLIWRHLSALFDTLTIIVIFFIGRRLHNNWVGLIAAVLYAAAPLAIQKAHFGTVNAITAFFVTAALWAAVHVQQRGRYLHYTLFGVALGAAVAGRINVIPLAGVVVLAGMVQAAPVLDRHLSWSERQRILWHNVGGVFLAGLATILTFRILNPYAFIGPTIFHMIPNPRWLADLSQSSYAVSGASDIPPNWQWLGRPAYLFPLKDMLLWGMGIALGIMGWFGWAWAGYRMVRAREAATRHILLFAWVLVYFAWMGRLWVMVMRYYLPLYGTLAIFAGWALYELLRYAQKRQDDLPITRVLLAVFTLIFAAVPVYYLHSETGLTASAVLAGTIAIVLGAGAILPQLQRRRALILACFVVGFTVLWATMFTNIYRHQSTRVQASRWVWENVSGDFSMQVEGAPAGTPLINIAVPNSNGDSAEHPTDLPLFATRYEVARPRFVEFTAPASGTISHIYAPHLGDPLDDEEEETLYLSISRLAASGQPQLITEVRFNQNFTRENHLLGDSYEIPLDVPIVVVEGDRYSLKIEALAGGSIISAGNVVLTEGAWDDRITTIMACHLPDGLSLADDPPPGLATFENCNGLLSNFALVQSYDLAMAYPVDEQIKLDSILNGLQVGDYLTVTSNRFYDTLTRNRARWPMSSAYYDALFAGELGYELVEVFRESYSLGPFSVDDQHLPIYDSPQWFNEFEADEAFHVYDHPVVFIFRKAADYDHAQVRTILEEIPLQRADQITAGFEEIGAQQAGVVYWSSLEADEATTALEMPPEIEELNREGGTWSQRFDSDSILNTQQIIGVFVWWLAITTIGLVTWPILFVIFPTLGDRGYGFAKSAGLLLVGWVAWFASSLKLQLWSQGGIALTILLIAGLSASLAWQHQGAIRSYLRAYWRRLVWIEVLTTTLFLFFIVIRLTNPDMWHFPMGGERPMDFAYFNATLRSTVFPAYDPWYAGGYINYYYVGFVLVGSPVLLLKILPSIAYNLAIPTLFALTGIGAFSIAFNIVDHWRVNHSREDENKHVLSRRMGNPWLAGLAALMLAVFLGNLDTIRVLGHGLASLNGYQRPQGIESYLVQRYTEENGLPPDDATRFELAQRAESRRLDDRIAYEIHNSVDLVTSLVIGTGKALSGQTIPVGYNRWYWGPTRILAETPGIGGNAITEVPYFTFLFGDLHAHMINMPYMLLALLFVFNEVVLAQQDRRRPFIVFLALLLGGLTIGLMRAVNTWDWPTFMLFGVVGITYAWWLRWRRMNRSALMHLFLYVGGFLGLAFLTVLPYNTWYASIYNSVDVWHGGKTPLWAYLDIHGLFLFLIVSLLIWETGRWLRAVKVRALHGRGHWLILAALVTGFTFLLSLVAAMADYQVALIVLPLVLWIAALFFRPGQAPAMQFVLVLIGFGLSLTLGVEVIVIAGDIGRQNTVFKFYIETWLLFSVAGGVIFAWLAQHAERWSNQLRTLWFGPLLLLVSIVAMFPLMATPARSLDRLAPETPLTLNGLDYMQHAELQLFDTLAVVPLEHDYQIIRWLQENVEGTPVILEGRSVAASEYHYNGRIAINTGLPSVLGWRFHQVQQRTLDPLPRLVDQRELNVKFFYNTDDIPAAIQILRNYEVRYIVVGDMEISQTSQAGLEKFDQMTALGFITPVFEVEAARLYEVNQAALESFVRDQYAFSDAAGLHSFAVGDAAANSDTLVDFTLRTLRDDEIPIVAISDMNQLRQVNPQAFERVNRLVEWGVLDALYTNVDSIIYRVNQDLLSTSVSEE